jgi:hypothetical protein
MSVPSGVKGNRLLQSIFYRDKAEQSAPSGSIGPDAPMTCSEAGESLTFCNVNLRGRRENAAHSGADSISANMSIVQRQLDDLAGREVWTYRASLASASESAALAALALAAWNRRGDARRPAQWMADIQQDDGSVGVFATEPEPRWPTSLAVLAWAAVDREAGELTFENPTERAVDWCLADRGKAGTRSPQVGHDPSIVGWSWAPNTASWLEPTCFQVLALTAVSRGEHPRTQEGRRLIVDRLLPDGGANYGNTLVLGQKLVPHPAPSGIAMTALAASGGDDARINRSLDYLENTLEPGMTPMSLAWSIIGLTAHGRRPRHADAWVEAAMADARWQPLGANDAALLLLAARTTMSWLPSGEPATLVGTTR